jgi:hypothetical protein
MTTVDQGDNTHEDHLLSKENKFIRFKVNDLLAHTHIQMILIKIWKLLLELQHESWHNKKDVSVYNCVKFSVDLNVYTMIIPLLRKGYGQYYDTDYYVTK